MAENEILFAWTALIYRVITLSLYPVFSFPFVALKYSSKLKKKFVLGEKKAIKFKETVWKVFASQ